MVRIPSEFGKRTLSKEIRKEKSKVYLMYEGEKTEVQYFNALINKINTEGGNLLFETIPLLRSHNQRSNSHPKNIIQQIIGFMANKNKYKYLNEILTDYLILELNVCQSKYSEDELKELVNNICNEILKYHHEDDLISTQEVVEYLQKLISNYFSTEQQIRHFIEYLNSQTTFSLFPNDKICLIIDGDHKSFSKKDNFLNLLETTNSLGIDLYVRNPNFEFWLLLHSPNISKYDNNKLLKNEKVNKHKWLLESILSKEFNGYNKSHIRPERFIQKLAIALQQSKNYCENLFDLNEKLGTNVGNLIRYIMKESK